MAKLNVDKFIEQGAIFADPQGAHVFWGDLRLSDRFTGATCIYAPDFFFKSKDCWFEFSDSTYISKDDLIALLNPLNGPTQLDWQPPDKAEFSNAFARVHAWIQQGLIKKAVPFISHCAKWQGDSQHLVSALLKKSLTVNFGMPYGLWYKDELLFGVSPEILIESQDQRQWQTMALAGTCDLGQFQVNPEKFLTDPKELLEHQLVVDFIKDSLSDYGRVECGEQTTQRNGQLVHLLTPITLTCDEAVSGEKIIGQLHPTPALGCYPQKDWQRLLPEMTSQWRGRYGAPFGFFHENGQSRILVAIRNVQKHHDQLKILTGCGVVESSQLENEWIELSLKRQAVQKMLAL